MPTEFDIPLNSLFDKLLNAYTETTIKPARQQRSEAEIKEILKEYEESNLTVREFCELFSISEQTLYNWRNKFFPKGEEPGEFIPMSLPVATPAGIFAEIEVKGKIFRFYHPVSADFFKALM